MTKNRILLLGAVAAAVVAALVAVWLVPGGSVPAGKAVVLDNEAPSPSNSPSSEAVASDDPTPEPSPTASPTAAEGDDPAEVIYRLQPSVNGDGSMVAFVVSVHWDTGELHSDIYVRSRSSHTTSLISISNDGERGNLDSWNPAISADGTKVAFISTSSNLVPGDTNDVADVFVRDMVKHTTTRISVSSGGAQGTATSGYPPYAGDGHDVGQPPALSEDGRYIAFVSQALNLAPNDTSTEPDVFRHDLSTGETILVSARPDGTSVDGVGPYVSISADGRLVAFDAQKISPSLPPTGDQRVVYVRDVEHETTTLVSLGEDGNPLPGTSSNAALAADGRSVAFIWRHEETDSTWDVMKRTLSSATTTRLAGCGVDTCGAVALSGDGTVAVYTKYIGGLDPFCYIAGASPQYLGSCRGTLVDVSENGRWIAFEAGIDALSDPADEERFGGNYGAMLYDRSTNDYTAAWLI